MTKGYDDDFLTVDLLVKSNSKTGRTDAFIVAYTKLERQARRIFTYIIYQYPAFSFRNYREIVDTIASKAYLDFPKFLKGFDALYPMSIESIVGSSLYTSFIGTDFQRIKGYRNKIIHGQITGRNLNPDDLKKEIGIISNWCSKLAESMMTIISYDGFSDSIRKSTRKDFTSSYKISISTSQELDTFIESRMKKK